MKYLLFGTDLHLDTATDGRVLDMFQNLPKDCSGIVLAGDTCRIGQLEDYLAYLHCVSKIPIYFTLGRQEFYGSSIAETYDVVDKIQKKYKSIIHLPSKESIILSPTTCIVGIDSIYDLKAGDYEFSDYTPNDFRAILDFQKVPRSDMRRVVQIIASGYFKSLYTKMELANFKNIILVMHVPPFQYGCFRNPAHHDHFAPFLFNVSNGTLLKHYAEAYTGRNISVYCGHTHFGHESQILPNLKMIVGGASYMRPKMQYKIQYGFTEAETEPEMNCSVCSDPATFKNGAGCFCSENCLNIFLMERMECGLYD